MEIRIKDQLTFFISVTVVLAIFYAIYFIKKIEQKRKGIQTRQIGSRREKTAHTIEILMSAATLCIVPIQLFSAVVGFSCLPVGARFTGLLIGLLGDGIFLVSVICMKDSWRAGIPDKDKTELVTSGIYKYSRNPAFLAFDLQYVGVLLLYCNVLSAAFTVFAVVMLHLQILQEEKYLEKTFGEEYLNYNKKTFRYLGRKK